MAEITRDDVMALLRERLAAVLGLASDEVTEDARFNEDLHADSLDLVEVIEAVERRLGERGVEVALPEDDLVDALTVGDAVDRITAAARHA